MRDKVFKIAGLVSFGFIVVTAVGLARSLLVVSVNRYVDHGLYYLTLLSLQDYVNLHLLAFFCAGIVIAFVWVPLRAVSKKKACLSTPASDRAKLQSVAAASILVLGSSIVLIGLFRDLRPGVSIESLVLSFDPRLSRYILTHYTPARLVAIVLMGISLLAAIALCSRILRALGSQSRVQRVVSKTIYSGAMTAVGVGVLGLIVAFNCFMYFYRQYNLPDGANVILISVDTLRADHMSGARAGRVLAPNIERLAERGTVFLNALSQSPWTLPSMASLHTSLYPSEHRAQRYNAVVGQRLVTLAEYLRDNGYKTIAVVSNRFVTRRYGFSQGFDVFDEGYLEGEKNGPSGLEISRRAIGHLTECGDEPFFLWIHYVDPHGSYIDHAEFDYGRDYRGSLPAELKVDFLEEHKSELESEDLKYVVDVYDEEISYTDSCIGEVIDAVEEKGLSGNTVIVITSDHGEEFLERGGFGHGKHLYQELIHVPLVVYDPRGQSDMGREVREAVELRSIPRTVLSVCGLDGGEFSGRDLKSVAKRDEDHGYLFSEGGMGGVRKACVIAGGWKLIHNQNEDTFELYNLREDPKERDNLFGQTNERIRLMQQALMKELRVFKDRARRGSPEKTIALSKKEMERLRALGYVK